MSVNVNLFPESIDKALGPAMSTIGRSLNSIFLTIFMPFQKLGLRKELELEEYALSIRNKISEISEDKLIPPPLHVAGPILDASKYYIESEVLREMFATLLASSMNADKAEFAHPSFVEIIKQLSPFDASFLKEIITDDGFHPLININLKSSSVDPNAALHSFIRVFQNYTYTGLQGESNAFIDSDPQAIASCVQNLDRLGIIEISDTVTVSDPKCYPDLWDTPGCKRIIDKHIAKMKEGSNPHNLSHSDYAYSKRSFTPTGFGLDFINSCI